MTHSLGTRCALILLPVLPLAGCGGGDAKSTSSPSITAAPVSTPTTTAMSADPRVTAFCAALRKLSTGSPTPPELEALLREARANAPAGIQSDAAAFVANSRAVTAAFAAAGGSSRSVDTQAVLATLTPEQRQFVSDLASVSKGGPVPANSTGRVLAYQQQHCTTG